MYTLARLEALTKQFSQGQMNNLAKLEEGGTVQNCGFFVNPPATSEYVRGLEAELGTQLPESYKTFLSHHDGGVFYLDLTYGQWGVKLHGTSTFRFGDVSSQVCESMLMLNREQAGWFTNRFLAFASWVAEYEYFAFDLTQPIYTSRGLEYPIFLLPEIDFARGAIKLSNDFAGWIDHTLAAQGEKWWEWREL